jgi:hypothetical protein
VASSFLKAEKIPYIVSVRKHGKEQKKILRGNHSRYAHYSTMNPAIPPEGSHRMPVSDKGDWILLIHSLKMAQCHFSPHLSFKWCPETVTRNRWPEFIKSEITFNEFFLKFPQQALATKKCLLVIPFLVQIPRGVIVKINLW